MTAVDRRSATWPFSGEFAWAYDHLAARPGDATNDGARDRLVIVASRGTGTEGRA